MTVEREALLRSIVSKLIDVADDVRPCPDGRMDIDLDWSSICLTAEEAAVVDQIRETP